jgi:hypothetical protein
MSDELRGGDIDSVLVGRTGIALDRCRRFTARNMFGSIHGLTPMAKCYHCSAVVRQFRSVPPLVPHRLALLIAFELLLQGGGKRAAFGDSCGAAKL